MLIGLYQIYPAIYNYTTQGVTALLQLLYQKEAERIRDKRADSSPAMVELVAMLERTLNFMHTGNATCLVRRLMDSFWLSRSLLVDGLPSVNDQKVTFQNNGDSVSVLMHIERWPTYPRTGIARSAAKASMLFRYGHDQFNVSKCFYCASSWSMSFHFQRGGG